MPAPRNASKPHSRAHRAPIGAQNAMIDLPSTGCTLPAPPMPAGRSWTAPEAARWSELWGSPQAVQWDESATGTVAVLIAYEAAILAGTASAWMAQEARYASESLGLTPRALGQLGWRIVSKTGATE